MEARARPGTGQFANRSCSVLVATDVAARGLDIAQLEAVINVDVTPDPEVHPSHRPHRPRRPGWLGPEPVQPARSPAHRHHRPRHRHRPEWHTLGSLRGGDPTPLVPPMVTLQMLGGRKEKIRPGDVLGALTADKAGTRPVLREEVGKITITDQATCGRRPRICGRRAAQAPHRRRQGSRSQGAIAET